MEIMIFVVNGEMELMEKIEDLEERECFLSRQAKNVHRISSLIQLKKLF